MEEILIRAIGLFSIVIKSKKSSVIKFVNSLEFGIGYSWGGFESLAILQDQKNKLNTQKGDNSFVSAKMNI